jgi:hypothetical protein
MVNVGLCALAAWLERSTDAIPLTVIGVWMAVLSAVAALVAAKRPKNAVGWLLLATAFALSMGLFCTAYGKYATEVDPGSLPFPEWVAWGGLWAPALAAPFVILAFLLFPNGELLSSRWRVLVWIIPPLDLGVVGGLMVKPGPIDNVMKISNPLRIGSGHTLYELSNQVLATILTFIALAAIASLVLRMRRAQGAEKQQIKWFVYSVAIFPVFFITAMLADAILDAQLGPGDHYVDFALVMAGALLIPLAMGVSMMRYRLYEIDLIINRTLVYAALTATLAGIYLGVVVLLQQLIAPIASDSQLAVAGSTLAVAALFRPLRTRIQGFIDRRFYRRKFDVAETLSEFTARMKDQVDLDALTSELVAVVGTTIQPAHVSLWLRSENVR